MQSSILVASHVQKTTKILKIIQTVPILYYIPTVHSTALELKICTSLL